jgi:NAD(P)-dependent dehydrogenase (short-subunit alcohol dehydrogenase family)
MMDEKHFLIVGGSSGIGLEIVKALHEKGNNVYVGSRTNDQLAELAGVHHLPLDVTADPLNLEGLPEVLNGIVYCPGTIQLKPFQRLTIDDFLKDLQVNFLGAVRTIQACLTRLRKSKTGASVVLFSTVAVKTGMPFHASVAGAKAAVEGLTRSLAAEIGTPQEIAGLAVHLLSDASTWLTGQIIHIDGGMSALRTFR